MPDCEICGQEKESLMKAIVEGALFNVCEGCYKFGNVIVVKQPKKEERIIKRETTEIINIVNQNYPSLIKNAREKLGLKQQELALQLNEKESIIHKLETGSLQPTIVLAKKLEKVLKINLVELYQESHESINLKDDKLTIGDLLKLRK